MNSPFLAWLHENYHWDLSLYALIGILALGWLGKQLVLRTTVEIEGEPKPACVAESVVLLLA